MYMYISVNIIYPGLLNGMNICIIIVIHVLVKYLPIPRVGSGSLSALSAYENAINGRNQ